MYYHSKNGGCLFGVIFLIIFLFVLMFFANLLFSPIGLIIIIGLIINHLIKKYFNSPKKTPEFKQNEYYSDDNSKKEDPFDEKSFDREAEDIEYKELD